MIPTFLRPALAAFRKWARAKKIPVLRSAEEEARYLSRRRFLKLGLAGAAAGGVALALSSRVGAPSTELVLQDDFIRLKGEVADPSLLDGMVWYRSDLARLRFSPDGVSAKSIAHTDELGGGGAPADADYLVGTANAGLSAEIVVGTTPGGELGGTWGSPTVDATHSGSAHHAQTHAIDGADHTGDIETAQIANDAVTYAKIQNVSATDRLLGRDSAGAGDVEELTVAAVLAMLGAFSGITIQVFTTPGANTYTPTSGMKFCIAISTGAGGGGGGADVTGAADAGCGGGGGAGGTCIEVFTAAQIGASQTVTIGTGGTAGGATGTAGGAGGNTTFGALHTANGGVGGNSQSASTRNVQIAAGGAGGIPTGGTVNITGGTGHTGKAILTIDATDANEVAFAIGGEGGSGFWGGGGRGGANAQDGTAADSTAGSEAGAAGAAPGSGGGGGAVLNTATGVAGGAGANGICIVIEFT